MMCQPHAYVCMCMHIIFKYCSLEVANANVPTHAIDHGVNDLVFKALIDNCYVHFSCPTHCKYCINITKISQWRDLDQCQ